MHQVPALPLTVFLVFQRTYSDSWEFIGITTNEEDRRRMMVGAEATPKSGQAVWRQFTFDGEAGGLRDPPPPEPKTAWERLDEEED